MRHRSVRSTLPASADEVFVVFTRLCPHLWLLRATSRRQAQHLCACRHSVANAPLPGGASTPECVSLGAVLLSRGGGEESSPAPSERNAKHEHDRKPHLHRMPRNRSAAHESNRQANHIPSSTAGMENCFTPGMSHTRHHATVRNTGSGSRLLEDAHRESSLLQF
jgi:hypothetical protein